MDKNPMEKKDARLRRARRARARIHEQRAFRLTVHRTPSHIYAQIIAPEGDKVVVAASTLEADVKKGLKHCGNVVAAQAVGKAIAEKAKKAGITAVAFDRSGFRYHGRVKALADAARESGLQF
jgi:large subunit ribosomal protein L18